MARARRILIVEDDAKTAASVDIYLRHDGFRTELARSGTEALHKARDGKPDLIVLDLMLPGLGGIEDLAIADAGALTLHRERIDLGATIARIVGAQAELTCDAGITVDADVTRLRQIVHNVLANALRHTPDGERVRVRVARAGGDATVSVIDRGPGIAARDLDRIFERFYRVDEARGRERGGAGLGLAIVRQLVELHGGRVWADSVEGEGATFTFTLPLASS